MLRRLRLSGEKCKLTQNLAAFVSGEHCSEKEIFVGGFCIKILAYFGFHCVNCEIFHLLDFFLLMVIYNFYILFCVTRKEY